MTAPFMAAAASGGRAKIRADVILILDTLAAFASLLVAIDLRVGETMAAGIIGRAPWLVLGFIPIAAFCLSALKLPSRIWRYSSLSDLMAIAKASLLTIIVYVLVVRLVGPPHWLPRSVPFIHWFVMLVFLGGIRAMRRLAYGFMTGAVRPPVPVPPYRARMRRALVLGHGEDIDTILRWIEWDGEARMTPVGVLSETGFRRNASIRGVPILGGHADLKNVVERLESQGRRPDCILFAGNADRIRGAAMVGLVATAQQLGLNVVNVAGVSNVDGAASPDLDLRFLDIANLLDRPQRRLPVAEIRSVVAGRRVMVTGAGGTIGRELVRQIAALGPAELQLLDAGEFALYEADLELKENFPALERRALLCSIRQRDQLFSVFARHRPELVFHAAALKHVPLVEANLAAGMLTNVIGTRNVADAARAFGAQAMVQVSTDKAVNPVGSMGMTKRLGELYAQALDLEGASEGSEADAPRFMTVRFGNVLGSSGSLIPLFQRQLSRGGPLTVTHPEMTRFFMTVGEAVGLVLYSSSHGLGALNRGRIFVLDMGRPVRILDVARRMIRLAGLEPEVDVPIEIVGLRPGEKLFEELFDTVEDRLPSQIPGVFEALPRPLPLLRLQQVFARIEAAALGGDDETCAALGRALLAEAAAEVVPAGALPMPVNDAEPLPGGLAVAGGA